jgi:hypothetical protein
LEFITVGVVLTRTMEESIPSAEEDGFNVGVPRLHKSCSEPKKN